MLGVVSSASLHGIEGRAITVEVHVTGGLPAFAVVGLPDASCREARDRVRAAIQSSGFEWPIKKVTVNLAPSGVPKTGAGLDLAIAVAVLVASEQLDARLVQDMALIAELGLDGALRSVPGALPLTAATACPTAVIAPSNLVEASLVSHRKVHAVRSLRHLADVLKGTDQWCRRPTEQRQCPKPPLLDLASVQGQGVARRAAEISAAGGHHLLLVGPPGAGKTMIAKALPGLLPVLDEADALQVTTVHSAAGLALPPGGLVSTPPFRAPHHSSSMVSLVGGGTRQMRPGEISCAHGGVLFLDELGEFAPTVLDALRQPLEDGAVRVARAFGSVTFPARFVLAAATNPCPCGDASPDGRPCRCTDAARARYARRLSGPLLDRFDLRVHMARPSADELFATEPAESSASVAQRVSVARSIAKERGLGANVRLPPDQADMLAELTPRAKSILVRAVEQGRLSARGVHRVRCVARTIADLDSNDGPLSESNVAAALALRADPMGYAPALEAS